MDSKKNKLQGMEIFIQYFWLIPINPRNMNDESGLLKQKIIITAANNGIFIKTKSFLLVNLSIKKPEIINVITDNIE